MTAIVHANQGRGLALTDTAERIGNHLAESRRQGLAYPRAWSTAVADVRPEPDFPLAVAKRLFEQGYNRRRVGTGDGRMGMLTGESENLTVDHEYVAPEFVGVKRCGSGAGCNELRTPRAVKVSESVYGSKPDAILVRVYESRMGGLCARHRAEVRAAFKRSHYRSPTEVAFGEMVVPA